MPTLQETAETLRTQLTNLSNDATETIAKTTVAARQAFLDANRTAAKSVDKLAAQLPELPTWMPAAPSVDVADALKQVFDAQQTALETNKQFALDLVEIWTGNSTAKKAAKPAAKSSK